MVFSGPSGRLTDVDTGLTVFVTLYNDIYVMRNHTWH